MFDVYLASQSPRRRQLLSQIGVEYQVVPVEVDESLQGEETVEDYVKRLAEAKARVGALLVEASDMPVLGADTAVYVEGEVIGKPRDFPHFKSMMTKLSGTTHQVVSGVAVMYQGEVFHQVSKSHVTLKPISEGEIKAYWRTGEPEDKAGGYALQGIGSVFVTNVQGSCSGVVGLPLLETSQLLAKCGIPIFKA